MGYQLLSIIHAILYWSQFDVCRPIMPGKRCVLYYRLLPLILQILLSILQLSNYMYRSVDPYGTNFYSLATSPTLMHVYSLYLSESEQYYTDLHSINGVPLSHCHGILLTSRLVLTCVLQIAAAVDFFCCLCHELIK